MERIDGKEFEEAFWAFQSQPGQPTIRCVPGKPPKPHPKGTSQLVVFREVWRERTKLFGIDVLRPPLKNFRLVQVWAAASGECHLCGLYVPHPVLELDKMTEENLPTVDHVRPKAEGGRRTPGNVKLAHRFCNTQRGTQPVTEELKQALRFAALLVFGGE
jgi:hypothetical protein